MLANTLDQAIAKYLENDRLPKRKVNELDNRGSTFYLTLYWAEALASQDDDKELKDRVGKLSGELSENEAIISQELLETQGKPADIGGYYMPDMEKAISVMRPSRVLNTILDSQ